MKIKEAIKDKITGEWGDADDVGLGVQVLRTTNFTNAGRISYEKVVKRNIPNSLIEKKKLLPGDIIIEKSGGSPNQPVGRVVFFDNNNDLFLCNNFTAILRPSERLVPKYFFYDLFYKHLSQLTLKYQNKTTGIINLQLDRYLDEKINVPSFDKQKQIVQILDTADALRQKRKEQLNLLDDYLKSVFFEMFGDLVMNDKGWYTNKLSEISEVVSGVTKGRKLNPENCVTVPYMRVANVQDGHINISDLKEISVLPSDVEKYRLQRGDVLLTEGGDPDKLGRGAVWYYDITNCIHQNHIFRVRISSTNIIQPLFLSWLIGSAYGKRYFFRAAKQTTGIATINSTQLKIFPVQIPPIDLQNKFASIVEQVEQTKQKMCASLDEMDNHFNALMQRYFG